MIFNCIPIWDLYAELSQTGGFSCPSKCYHYFIPRKEPLKRNNKFKTLLQMFQCPVMWTMASSFSLFYPPSLSIFICNEELIQSWSCSEEQACWASQVPRAASYPLQLVCSAQCVSMCVWIYAVCVSRYGAVWSTYWCQRWCQSLEGKLTSLFPNPHGRCQLGGLVSANECSLLSRTGRSTRKEKGSGKRDKKGRDRGIPASHLGDDFSVARFHSLVTAGQKKRVGAEIKDWEKSKLSACEAWAKSPYRDSIRWTLRNIHHCLSAPVRLSGCMWEGKTKMDRVKNRRKHTRTRRNGGESLSIANTPPLHGESLTIPVWT